MTVVAAAADVVLFLAADLHDLPRHSRTTGSTMKQAHESPLVDAGAARCPGRRRDRWPDSRSRMCSPGTASPSSSAASLKFGEENRILEEMHHVPLWIVVLPTVMMVLGFAVAWQFYIQRPDLPVDSRASRQLLYRFLLNKWYFDELYDVIFVRPAKWLGRFLWKERRRLADRRLRPGRRLGARARRHPQRGAAADRLPLPLRLRHADRRRRA